jgi:hypothetical protein
VRDRRISEADEHGTITLWVLGLCLCVMMLGGMSLDLWRGITMRRELQSMADAAAIAGADGLDQQSLRNGGAALDPTLVRELAQQNLAAQSDARAVDDADIAIAGDGATVVVDVRGHVDLSLLGLLGGHRRLDVSVHASAQPRREP